MKRILIIGALIALVAIVGTLLLRAWANAPDPARLVFQTKAHLNAVKTAAIMFHMDFGRWPTNANEFTRNEKNIIYFKSEDFLRDKWENYIVIEQFEPKRGYGRIISFGRDGKLGGKGYDADLEVQFSENDK